MSWLIYGKRIGKKVNNMPVYDKTFRALDYAGVRVTKLADAGEYATKEDAQEVLDAKAKKIIEQGLAIFEIRQSK